MIYIGKVENGVVVLERANGLAEGTIVRVEPIANADRVAETSGSWAGDLPKLAGAAGPGLPADLADSHDHYLHGMPKR